MKPLSEWRYGDGAFNEVTDTEGARGPTLYAEVFRECDQEPGYYYSMGWFESTYFDGALTCWVAADFSRAYVCSQGWGHMREPLAELRQIDSPRQLVEWCMMVREMVNG